MRVFIVHAHHEPTSFNAAMTRTAAALARYRERVLTLDTAPIIAGATTNRYDASALRPVAAMPS